MSASAERDGIEVEPGRLAGWLREDAPPELIDVREPHEHEAGHIEGTRHVRLSELSAAAQSLPRERPLVFYCRVGARSQMAAEAFRASGFEAYTMTGGLLRWAQAGLPLQPEDGFVADD